MWYMTPDMWHMPTDKWQVTCDAWHTCLDDLKEKDLTNELIKKGVSRIAPATPLNRRRKRIEEEKSKECGDKGHTIFYFQPIIGIFGGWDIYSRNYIIYYYSTTLLFLCDSESWS